MERDDWSALGVVGRFISTHTLTWSVTLSSKSATITGDFNSHAHVERDVLLRGYLPPVSNFNSHAHVERDQASCNMGR